MIINKITAEYDHPPIYVLENGVSNNDDNDDKRTSYLYSYMKAMLAAIHKDGCNVKAYTAWSLLDNFEWDRGYTWVFVIYYTLLNFLKPVDLRITGL